MDFVLRREDGSEPVFGKSVNSAFINTALEQHLRANDIDQIALCGFTSDHCVNTTARMGGNLGFAVIFVADAVATFARADPFADGKKIDADTIHRAALASYAHSLIGRAYPL
jgi:nicotinamidase-related amidase